VWTEAGAVVLLFTPLVARPLASCSFISFAGISAGSPQCFTRFDYIDRLLLSTLTPIIFVALLMVTCVFHVQVTPKHKFKEVIGHYTSCVLLLTYLVLPTVSTFIFGAFGCENVDPSGVVPGMPTYLRHDYSIACDSARYQFGVTLGIAMILVYPIGIPLMYFYLLYQNRHMISSKVRPDRTPASSIRTTTPQFSHTHAHPLQQYACCRTTRCSGGRPWTPPSPSRTPPWPRPSNTPRPA